MSKTSLHKLGCLQVPVFISERPNHMMKALLLFYSSDKLCISIPFAGVSCVLDKPNLTIGILETSVHQTSSVNLRVLP